MFKYHMVTTYQIGPRITLDHASHWIMYGIGLSTKMSAHIILATHQIDLSAERSPCIKLGYMADMWHMYIGVRYIAYWTIVNLA